MTQCLASPVDGLEDGARRLGPAEGGVFRRICGSNGGTRRSSSDSQRARVLARVKARRYAPPPLRGAHGLDAGSAHARPGSCLTMTNPDARVRGRRARSEGQNASTAESASRSGIRDNWCCNSQVTRKKALEVRVRPRRGTRATCSQCRRPASGLRHAAAAALRLHAPVAHPVIFVYAMRRVSCPRCGVTVEAIPWATGKHRLTDAYAWFLAGWAKRLSWQEVAAPFPTSWDTVYRPVRTAVDWGLSAPRPHRHRGHRRGRALAPPRAALT